MRTYSLDKLGPVASSPFTLVSEGNQVSVSMCMEGNLHKTLLNTHKDFPLVQKSMNNAQTISKKTVTSFTYYNCLT